MRSRLDTCEWHAIGWLCWSEKSWWKEKSRRDERERERKMRKPGSSDSFPLFKQFIFWRSISCICDLASLSTVFIPPSFRTVNFNGICELTRQEWDIIAIDPLFIVLFLCTLLKWIHRHKIYSYKWKKCNYIQIYCRHNTFLLTNIWLMNISCRSVFEYIPNLWARCPKHIYSKFILCGWCIIYIFWLLEEFEGPRRSLGVC